MVRWLRREVIARRWPRRRFFLDISKTCRTIGSRGRSFIRSTRSCSCACWPYWQGPRPSPTSRVLARRSSLSCAAFGLSQAGRRRMIISATSSPRSTRRPSAGVSSPGVSALIKTRAEVIAIDGKTSRRSGSRKNAKEPIHMVSAFAARQRLVLGQVAVAEKSNEIVAIPALLDMMAIEGAVVTIDAMGCQRAIAKKVKDKKADYIIALKGNQGTLHEDVKLFVAEQKAKGFKDTTVSRHKTVDGDHGRIETRKYTMIHDVSWLNERHDWPGLAGVAMVESPRELPGKTERETRFYITSLSLPAERVGPMIRDHWAVENSLHWVMDMVFRDDECRVRTDNAPENFVTLKHMANNLSRRAPGKDSQRLKRMTAAWDDEFLASLVAA